MKNERLKHNGYRFLCGFTIVELLVVVLLIALIAGASGGIYVGTYKRMLVEKGARNFLLAAKYARITAIERQSECRIALDVKNNRFWLVVTELNEDTGETEQVILRDVQFKPVSFSGKVRFEKIQIRSADSEELSGTTENQGIVFLPDGTADSAAIQIGDGKNHYSVGISAATGKAKVYASTIKNVKSKTIDLDAQEE